MKLSFIATVFNEESTIEIFIKSIFLQTKLPDEIIIVDGGSNDKTLEIIKTIISSEIKGKLIRLYSKKGNRSVGRNYAIKKASHELIACSDAGNILDRKWVENIIYPFRNPKIDVVAGYYKSKAKTLFEKCVTPYVLVTEDRIDSDSFLPATRSMAFRKKIWKKVGGFSSEYSHNEDYVFANKLKKTGANIFFEKRAIVNWLPRKNFLDAFIMFFRFAFGDAESSMWRVKVFLIFARYFILAYLLFLAFLYKSFFSIFILLAASILYLLWSAYKNKKYAKSARASLIFIELQLVSDIAVMLGTTLGIFKNVKKFNYLENIKRNKSFLFITFLYVLLVFVTINYGIPNTERPFPFHMDEWHQLHAVWTTFSKGTPNTEGSANGTILHFLISGFYIAPFVIFKLVDPNNLEVNDLIERMHLFQILRFNTIIFGTLSLFVVYKITKYLKLNSPLVLALFACSPIWLMLSGYFKYDIVLSFFILISIYALLYFVNNPTFKNFVLAGIPVGAAFSVKVSALPIIGLYLISYFLFTKKKNWRTKNFVVGLSVVLSVILLFGVPDTLFGKGNILFYLNDNLFITPAATSNYKFGMHYLEFLYIKMYPELFGHGLYIFSFLAITYSTVKVVINPRKAIVKNRELIFFLVGFLFLLLSILSLRINAVGNRVLVLLPFIVFISGITLRDSKILKKKLVFLTLFGFILMIQIFESLIFVHLKTTESPQAISSEWIERNIPVGSTIGIENIPIYQVLPDIIHKEFYFNEYGFGKNNKYNYMIVNSESKLIPRYVVITNGEFEEKVLKRSVKKDLIYRLEKEDFRKIATFEPSIKYYKFFGDPIVFNIFSLFASPLNTTVFERNSKYPL